MLINSRHFPLHLPFSLYFDWDAPPPPPPQLHRHCVYQGFTMLTLLFWLWTKSERWWMTASSPQDCPPFWFLYPMVTKDQWLVLLPWVTGCRRGGLSLIFPEEQDNPPPDQWLISHLIGQALNQILQHLGAYWRKEKKRGLWVFLFWLVSSILSFRVCTDYGW